jgi:CheY-like chemotaxis protein
MIESEPADALVVDDSDIARASIVQAIERRGISVVQLASPIGATSEIVRRKVKVVVLDINMPSMPGDKLAELFRKNRRFGKDLKILLVSGTAASRLESLAEAVGADAVMPKDAGADLIAATVERLLAET